MKIRMMIHVIVVAFVLTHCSNAYSLKSTIENQTSVQLTVYNNNLGLVKDTRKIQLPKGEEELRFMDVAAFINPVTVSVKSLNKPKDFFVLEQNYEYDLMNQNKILDKYVGKNLKILQWNEYQDRKEVVEATLLSNNDGQVYRINEEIYLGHPGTKILPQLPENLIDKPTLTWLFKNKTSSMHELEVTYLTSNISWKADYVLILDKADIASDLSGWVTIDNRSGTMYKEAQLKLIAGDVSRVSQATPKGAYVMEAMALRSDRQFEEKSFFDYHIYDLKRKTTIKDNQTKQINFIENSGIKIQKEYRVQGNQSYYSRSYGSGEMNQSVQVFVVFENTEKNQLGLPLPKGIVRVYKKDDDESLQFVGEDRINHTPREETVELKIGNAFDITSNRKQIDYKKKTKTLHESEWQVALKNVSTKDVTIALEENLYGNWKVLKTSHPYEKINANQIQFDVAVPKGKEVILNYRIQVGLE